MKLKSSGSNNFVYILLASVEIFITFSLNILVNHDFRPFSLNISQPIVTFRPFSLNTNTCFVILCSRKFKSPASCSEKYLQGDKQEIIRDLFKQRGIQQSGTPSSRSLGEKQLHAQN